MVLHHFKSHGLVIQHKRREYGSNVNEALSLQLPFVRFISLFSQRWNNEVAVKSMLVFPIDYDDYCLSHNKYPLEYQTEMIKGRRKCNRRK